MPFCVNAFISLWQMASSALLWHADQTVQYNTDGMRIDDWPANGFCFNHFTEVNNAATLDDSAWSRKNIYDQSLYFS